MSTLHLRAILSLALALVALLWSNALLSLGELKDKQAQFSRGLGLSEKATFFRMALLLIWYARYPLLFVAFFCFMLSVILVIEPIIVRLIADDYVLVFYLICIAASLAVLLLIVLMLPIAALLKTIGKTAKMVGKIVSRVIVRVGIVLFSPEKLGLSIYQFMMISILVFISFSLPIWIPSDRPLIIAQVGLFLIILSILSYFVVASLPFLAWLWLRNPGVRDWFERVNRTHKAAKESLRFNGEEAFQKYKELLSAYLEVPIELLLSFPTFVITWLIQYRILGILLWILWFAQIWTSSGN